MFKRVLIPLDGSMLAESALEPALHLAEKTGGTVNLMRVPVFIDSGAQTSPEYHRVWTADNIIPEYEDTAAYLREIKNRIARPGVSIRTIVGEGERASAIVKTAAERNVDLIVMASHGRSGVSRWLLGSIAGKVISQAHVPVMLIRQPSNFDHILIALDGSQLSERIIEPAQALARGFNSRITLIRIADDSARSRESIPEEDYLDSILSRYADSGVDMQAITGKGPVTEAILSCAAENEVDIVAMSTHGRSGLRKLIYGSVTEKVMNNCGKAMLIIRPTESVKTGLTTIPASTSNEL